MRTIHSFCCCSSFTMFIRKSFGLGAQNGPTSAEKTAPDDSEADILWNGRRFNHRGMKDWPFCGTNCGGTKVGRIVDVWGTSWVLRGGRVSPSWARERTVVLHSPWTRERMVSVLPSSVRERTGLARSCKICTAEQRAVTTLKVPTRCSWSGMIEFRPTESITEKSYSGGFGEIRRNQWYNSPPSSSNYLE